MTSSWSRAEPRGGAALSSPRTPQTGARPPSMSSPSRSPAWLRSTEASLLALSAGLELLEAFDLEGTVYSDCQGLVKKLQYPQVLRRTSASAGFPLIRSCARRLQHPSRKQQWVRSYPERSRTPRTGWDQLHWGIFLADRYACTPASLLCRASSSRSRSPSHFTALRMVPCGRTTGTGPQRVTLPCSLPWGAR